MSPEAVDLLVVGAGPTGATAARLAADRGLRVLVVDRRDHLAGNCYDSPENEVLVHRYGPHYFRTSDETVFAFLSRFTGWIPGRYEVQARYRLGYVPMPVNRTTLEKVHGVSLPTEADAQALLDRVRVPLDRDPETAEEHALATVGPEVYHALIEGYTQKQWGRHPRDLHPAPLGRLPVRLNRDTSYVDARYKVMPDKGYTALFAAVLDHPLIEVRLGTDYGMVRDSTHRPRVGTVYTGPLDEFFDYRLGRLEWRSLSFVYRTFYGGALRQPCVQVNVPSLDYEHTRVVEARHVTGQETDRTVLVYEYPSATGEPFYPMPDSRMLALAGRYQHLAMVAFRDERIRFAGRLAEYVYINTDQAIERGMDAFDSLYARALHDGRLR